VSLLWLEETTPVVPSRNYDLPRRQGTRSQDLHYLTGSSGWLSGDCGLAGKRLL